MFISLPDIVAHSDNGLFSWCKRYSANESISSFSRVLLRALAPYSRDPPFSSKYSLTSLETTKVMFWFATA
ncbi:MAG: hypothetical protein UV89_C0018G0019 [candidate division WWE3 bacterium GW2011_GWB2_43_22]|uniref:Uncharacterized protein n=1 Tax=candidate division WWE3 bacterium GW2011_GWB2_43_22 TaxID=1619118 RepID=A0A0G1HJF2_UNCKA|nr:MAG: hypothetical protein UV89_C0018G0019 [candidate division WWE3 bacterium GW2011_GWB2_43_22]